MFDQKISWIYCILFFLCAFVIVCALVPLVKKIAFKIGAVDTPSNRRVHTKTTARLGGVAIFTGIATCCILATIGTKYLEWEIPLSYNNIQGVNYFIAGAGAIFMFAVGIADDAKYLPPKTKLVLQIIAAIITCCSGLLIYRVFNPFTNSFIEFGWFAFPITIFYLVAFANIINLIDGLDGLAAGISTIVAGTIFVFAITQNKADAAILSIGIMGSCMAFLIFNFNPAKIFMGDSGSLTLGFLLGIASLLATTRTAVVVSMMVPVLAAGVPIIDTLFAIIRRKRSHMPIDQADKGHIHHQLLKSGLSQKTTVLIMWAWTILLSVCGIVVTICRDAAIDTIVILLALGFTIFMVVKLHLFEPVLKHHYNHRKMENRKERKTKYGIYNTQEFKAITEEDLNNNDSEENKNE